MRKVLVIAVREYLASVRTKSFLVSLLMMPLLMGASVVLQIIFKNIEDTGEKRFAVIDRSAGAHLFAALEKAAERRNTVEIFDPDTHKQIRPTFAVERIEPSTATSEAMAQQRFELCQQILAGKYFGLLEIGPDVYQYSPGSGAISPQRVAGGDPAAQSAGKMPVLPDAVNEKEQLLTALSSPNF